MEVKINKLGKVSITVDKDYWSNKKRYDRLTVVQNQEDGMCYISRIPVPAGQEQQNNRTYWIPFGKPNITVSFGTFSVLAEVSELPAVYTDEQPYLIDGVAYFWTGDTLSGDTLDGKYQSVEIKGESGEDGKDGKSAYEIWLAHGGNPSVDEETWLTNLKGKDGTDGVNGKDGITPRIDPKTGNWIIDKEVTNYPSRGIQGVPGIPGPPGPPGEPGTGGSTNIFVDEDNAKLVIVVTNHKVAPILTSPAETSQPVVIGPRNTYIDYHIQGSNITSDVYVKVSGKFAIKIADSDDTPVKQLTLNAEDVNAEEGVMIRINITDTSTAATTMGYNGTFSVISSNNEFTPRYVQVVKQGNNLNSPGQNTESSGHSFDEYDGHGQNINSAN